MYEGVCIFQVSFGRDLPTSPRPRRPARPRQAKLPGRDDPEKMPPAGRESLGEVEIFVAVQ